VRQQRTCQFPRESKREKKVLIDEHEPLLFIDIGNLSWGGFSWSRSRDESLKVDWTDCDLFSLEK
jgi:hypothetical protein